MYIIESLLLSARMRSEGWFVSVCPSNQSFLHMPVYNMKHPWIEQQTCVQIKKKVVLTLGTHAQRGLR